MDLLTPDVSAIGDHDVEVEGLPEFDHEEWQSCCVTMDKEATIFFSQLVISVFVLLFCVYQLCVLLDCDSQQTYIGLLTLIIGVWLPSPNLK
jgi:hypothetical protein